MVIVNALCNLREKIFNLKFILRMRLLFRGINDTGYKLISLCAWLRLVVKYWSEEAMLMHYKCSLAMTNSYVVIT